MEAEQETAAETPAENKANTVDLSDLKEMTIQALNALARELSVEGAAGMKKHDLIFKILQTPDREERAALRGGRARDPARRLRLPARAGVELPARARRHLRLALADPEVRPAHRATPSPARCARPRKASATSRSSRSRPSTSSRPTPAKDKVLFDNLTPALPERAPAAGDGAGQPDRARARHDDAPRQGPARADRGRPPHGQDDDPAEHRQLHRRQPPRGRPHRPAHRRAAGGGDGHAALGEGRGHQLHLRRAGHPPRAGRGDGDREGQAPGRAQARRGDPARLHHPPGPRLQRDRASLGQGALRRRRLATRCSAPSASSGPRATSRTAARSRSSPPPSWRRARAWTT